MEQAWEEERIHMQQLLKRNVDGGDQKQNELKLKEEIATLKTTLEAMQDRLEEKEVANTYR